jgi:hypothetical protein
MSLCGVGKPCHATIDCVKAITNYCLNPLLVVESSGIPVGDGTSDTTTHNYPILYSQQCQDLMKSLIVEVKARVVSGDGEEARAAAEELHSAISKFCARDTIATDINRFMQRSLPTTASMTTTTTAAPSWLLIGGSPPPQYDNVMNVNLNFGAITSTLMSPPLTYELTAAATTASYGKIRPYAESATISFRSSTLFNYSPKMVDALLRSSGGDIFVLQATTPRAVTFSLGDTTPSSQTFFTPTLRGEITHADENDVTKVLTVHLINVYVNTAYFYGTSSSVVVPPPFIFDATKQSVDMLPPPPTNNYFGWNQIPNPITDTSKYEDAKIGSFGISIFCRPRDDVLDDDATTTAVSSTWSTLPSQLLLGSTTAAADSKIEAVVKDLCACHLPKESVYKPFFKLLTAGSGAVHIDNVVDECYFPHCATSNFPTFARTGAANGVSTCPSKLKTATTCVNTYGYDDTHHIFSLLPATTAIATATASSCYKNAIDVATSIGKSVNGVYFGGLPLSATTTTMTTGATIATAAIADVPPPASPPSLFAPITLLAKDALSSIGLIRNTTTTNFSPDEVVSDVSFLTTCVIGSISIASFVIAVIIIVFWLWWSRTHHGSSGGVSRRM